MTHACTGSASSSTSARRQLDDPRALPSKQLRSEQARERLLDTGTRLLAAGGFDAVSIAQIAAEAGCSVGAFYQRFQNKQAYFEFLLDRVIDEVRDSAERALTPEAVAGLGLADTVALCVGHHAQVIRSNEGLIRAALAYSLHGSNDWQPIGTVGAWLNSHYCDLILRKCRGRDKVQARKQLVVGLGIISGYLVNSVAHEHVVMPLHHPDMTHWLSAMVMASLKVSVPQAAPGLPCGGSPPRPAGAQALSGHIFFHLHLSPRASPCPPFTSSAMPVNAKRLTCPKTMS